jgi:hypothetical protein
VPFEIFSPPSDLTLDDDLDSSSNKMTKA